MQRSIKLKILRPQDEKITWEEIGYLLRGLSFKVCRMSNFCMTRNLLRALHLETEHLNPQGHLYCYPYLAEEYPDVPAGIINATESRARKLFQRYAVSILRSEASLPNFRKDTSIPLPVAGYRIVREGVSDYFVDIQLLSRQEAKKRKLPGRIRFVVADNWRDKTALRILPKLADGSVKRGIGTISRINKAWYISIPYEAEEAGGQDEFVPGLVMGVKFGLQNALVYAFNFGMKRGKLPGEEIISRREKFRIRQRQIKEQYKWSGRKGHGRENALKPLSRLYEKERNYRNLTNSRYAKWIVEIAYKNNCGQINVEADSGENHGKKQVLLQYWPVWDLKNKIRLKAEEYGIEVVEIATDNLWLRCSQCGHIQKEPSGKRSFVCEGCGYGKEENKYGLDYISLEYNAARNLAQAEAKDLSREEEPVA